MEDDDIKAKVLVALSNLRGRDKEVIEMLFGINGIEYSPEQIAMKFGLTKTRVLQIKREALIKMKLALTA
jgi:DNA-directed RNA polymerase sigma subunit (sigma70/sigma32)